jgi:hypothetical protein
MTPQELVEAARPCLPLPGIGTIVALDYGVYIRASGATLGSGFSKHDAARLLVGAVVEECVRRGWTIVVGYDGDLSVAIYGTVGGVNSSKLGRISEADGTDAIAVLKCYAEAKRAKEETP